MKRKAEEHEAWVLPTQTVSQTSSGISSLLPAACEGERMQGPFLPPFAKLFRGNVEASRKGAEGKPGFQAQSGGGNCTFHPVNDYSTQDSRECGFLFLPPNLEKPFPQRPLPVNQRYEERGVFPPKSTEGFPLLCDGSAQNKWNFPVGQSDPTLPPPGADVNQPPKEFFSPPLGGIQRRPGDASTLGSQRSGAVLGHRLSPARGPPPAGAALVLPNFQAPQGMAVGVPPFTAKVDGDCKAFAFFIYQVEMYIGEYRHLFHSERQLIHKIAQAMSDGEVREWIAALHGEAADGLHDLGAFLNLMRTRFQDIAAQEEAEAQIRLLNQGGRPVKELVWEFRRCVGLLRDWPERLLVNTFKAVLDPKLREACEIRGLPMALHQWYEGAISLDQVIIKEKKPTPPLQLRNSDEHRLTTRQEKPYRPVPPRGLRCYRCGRGRHVSAECLAPAPVFHSRAGSHLVPRRRAGRVRESV